MINGLTNIALRNRLLVLILTVAMTAAGVYAFKNTQISAFPDVTPTMVQVFTKASGLSPQDVEAQISYPIEQSMYGIPGLKRVQSTSIYGLSRVTVYFKEDTDIYFARRLVNERLSQARRDIPEGLGEPKLGPISTALGRVAMYTLRSKQGYDHSMMELRTAQDWIAKPMLLTVSGITGVLSIGGEQKQYKVKIDADSLIARNLTVSDVRKAIISNNKNVGGSFINRGGEEFVIRGYGWVSPGDAGLTDLRNTMVSKQRNGSPILLKDVASVTYGGAIKRGDLIANGEEAVGGFALKLIYTNTQEVLDRTQAEIEKINRSLPEGMEIVPYYTQQSLVDKAVSTVENAMIQGAVVVVVLLYLFLGNIRSTFVVLLSIPLSLLFAFIMMWAMGLSANLMSLGGLAIAIGMMVDGSIVMVENFFRHSEERGGQDISIVRLVREAAHQVGQPIAFGVLIIIVVFLPLFTLQGTEGKMFRPMAMTISFALVGALIIALTLVPVLSTMVFPRNIAYGEPWLVRVLKAGYKPLLTRVQRFPRTVIGVSLVIFTGSLALYPFLGSEFVPTLREGTFMIRSTMPAGANLPKSKEYGKRVHEVVSEFPEVEGAYSRVGRAEVGGDPEPVNVIATVVNLKPLDEWDSGRAYEELQSDMAAAVEQELPALANNFSQPIRLRTDELLSGVRAQVAVSIFGRDLDKLAEIGNQIAELARNIPGAVDVRTQQQSGKRQIVVRPDREALALYGISVDKLMNTVEVGIGGQPSGKVFDGIRRFTIFTRLEKADRGSLGTIRNLPIRTAEGAIIPISRIASVEVSTGPKKISRLRSSRRLFVQLNVRGRDMGSVVLEIQEKVRENVEMPPGYFVEYGGQFENQRRAMQRLLIVVPVTLALIFLLLYSAFSSMRYAALIFLNVPFAMTGGIVSLYVSGIYLSVPAAVGFIGVFGVAMLNGVVLVSYINDLRERGLEKDEAVHVGAMDRLRPVLTTATTAMIGLIPLLLANGIGANVQRPLAAVVVGGLVTSTLLTLFVLPAVYHWFAEPREAIATTGQHERHEA